MEEGGYEGVLEAGCWRTGGGCGGCGEIEDVGVRRDVVGG